jgi:ligand-binding sensor domain-containing protein/signal transduction histidine kinase
MHSFERANKWLLSIGITLLLLCTFAQFARSEQLPLKLYTTADGLARDGINRIVRDSRGFLWFATHEGLSKFDGYQFINYTTDQGLPQGAINDLLETRSGDYWIATSDGVVYFNPKGIPQAHVTVANTTSGASHSSGLNQDQAMFVTYYLANDRGSRIVNVLLEDNDGSIWCGTENGLYKLALVNGKWTFQAIDLGISGKTGDDVLIEAIVQDQHGALWIGTGNGLYRRLPNGTVNRYRAEDGLSTTFINALLIDNQQRIWVGTRYGGLCELASEIFPDHSICAQTATRKDGLGSNWIASIFQASDGVLWVGTNTGLSKSIGPAGSKKFVSYSTAQGLSDAEVWAINEDRNGSLWLGTANGGAMKLVQNGFTTYDQRDGLGNTHILSIFEDRTGAVCAVSALNSGKYINRFDGERFTALWPKSFKASGWGWNQITFQDREGDWWLDSSRGVFRIANVDRFEQLAHARVKARYTTREGLGANDVFRLFEDSRGDIWISGIQDGPAGLTRWERATQTFHRFGPAEGINASPTAFREDAAGNLWIGFYSGDKIARYARGGFTFFTETEGKPAGMIRALYLDQKKRLWIGSSRGGLARIDHPEYDHPRFVIYTTAEGLSSNDVWSITEDRWGRIYLGTGRGLDQLDPESGHIRHYSTADGLARGKVEEAFRDRNGDLWFGTAEGLSRFVPQPEPAQEAPPIVISGLRVGGAAQHISALGETSLANLVLDPQQKDLQIDFVGLDFAPGEVTRYQYKLEGADKDWSAPTLQRSVSFAKLAPGKYRFLVRAVNAAGVSSSSPAIITFSILPPIWQRWWFLALAAIAVGLVAYRVHRYRLAQVLKLERVRMRIATDLHDDIGSSLSQVSVLSEVISRRIKNDPAVAEPLMTIGNVSRDLVDSLNDIVWAINPRRDRLSDLVQRMRRFASDVFTAREIDFTFRAPQSQPDVRVGADMRRDVFLIFKESVNNIVRHSQCSRADINFEVTDGSLKLTIADDGHGLNGQPNGEGNGLFSMRQRAANLGGSFDLISNNGSGTTVRITAPLVRPRWHWPGFHSNGAAHN